MAYHGYIPTMKNFLSKIQSPAVLEVGLASGITTIPLIVFMARYHKSFTFVGVDVLLQEQLLITLNNIDTQAPDQKIFLQQNSSLNVIPKLVNESAKFDLILLDGDHNYYTISKELMYLDKLASKDAIVIVDDYHGRWSDKDLWYSEREGYENVSQATQKVETQKNGIKPAVDEFLQLNAGWESLVPIAGEPIMLRRKKNLV